MRPIRQNPVATQQALGLQAEVADLLPWQLEAIRSGFRHGSRVIVAAALIMTSVFASFMHSHMTMVRPIGFALAFGILVDAFVVRMTVIPALMRLFGARAWYLPARLDRLLPDLDVEGSRLAHEPRADVRSAAPLPAEQPGSGAA